MDRSLLNFHAVLQGGPQGGPLLSQGADGQSIWVMGQVCALHLGYERNDSDSRFKVPNFQFLKSTALALELDKAALAMDVVSIPLSRLSHPDQDVL